MSTFENGELFVYTNGNRWELGMVKRPNGRGDGYFCWYSRGDTAANTPTTHMHKLSNAGFTHIEQLLDDATVDVGTCRNLSSGGEFTCSECGYNVVEGCEGDFDGFRHCPNCGRRIKDGAE